MIFCCCFATAQQQSPALFNNDASGRALYLKMDFPVEGSPYFNDDYQVAQITAGNGHIYHDIKIKINLLDHQVQYMSSDGKEMITDMPVKRIEFKNMAGENGAVDYVLLKSYPGVFNSPDAAVYAVLDSGRISLLKRITISFRDDKKYNEASTTRVFDRKEVYFSSTSNGEMKKLDKGKAAILELFSGSSDKIASFIDRHHLGCKSEADYKAIFKFYNTLQLQ